MVRYIDEHRDEFGVEPICTALQVAPSTYYAAKSRPVSARAMRDAVLIPILVAIWTANYRVYGAHKLWKAARRAGHDLGRDQVARLMRTADIHGVSRRRRLRTTRPDPTAARPADLVKRDFTATTPNQLWVTDLTYVPTWAGRRVRVFHRRCVQPNDRRLARRRAHAHQRGPRRLGDGTLVTRHPTRRTAMPLRRRQSQGGFNRPSQHLDRGGVDDDDARASEAGAVVSGADPFAGRADGCVAGGSRQVLGSDRAWCEDRRRGRGSARVIPCRLSVVPSRWWGEPMPAGNSVGPLSLVLRTRGHRAAARPRPWCARDRSPRRAVAIDDLARAAPQRVDVNLAARLQGHARAVACRAARSTSEGREAGSERAAARLRPGTTGGRGPSS